MTARGILITGRKLKHRVVGKVLSHHLFFLHDPLPEHEEIEWETDHKDQPGPHEQGQSD
jgi:hypothetical protein